MNIETDKINRKTFSKPNPSQMNVINRSYFFTNSTCVSHSNDIFNLITNSDKKTNILALISDNGVDFAPNNYLVFFSLGRLWKDLKLDQLILSSFAPYQSKYNPI